MSGEQRPDERPDFGPSGYLPARAATRARKIVLRAPLGLQWVVASLVAGLVIVIAGVLFLQRGTGAPEAPWVAVGAVHELGTSTRVDDDVLVVTAGGRSAAFAVGSDVAYCEASNRLESTEGDSWPLTGRGTDGTASLELHPTRVHDETLYLDPTRLLDAPSPTDDPVELGCA